MRASAAIRAGLCKVAVCVAADSVSSVRALGAPIQYALKTVCP
jgi:hypothetical protein